MHDKRPGKTEQGFTLIELMIAVAIVSILAVIAIPAYNDYVLRSNRVAAKGVLSKVALEEQRYYVVNRTFGKLTDVGKYSADIIGIDENQREVTKDTGLYNVTVTTATATAFTVTATATGRQAADTACASMTIDNNGIKDPANCWSK